jgi:hypothetical protein
VQQETLGPPAPFENKENEIRRMLETADRQKARTVWIIGTQPLMPADME